MAAPPVNPIVTRLRRVAALALLLAVLVLFGYDLLRASDLRAAREALARGDLRSALASARPHLFGGIWVPTSLGARDSLLSGIGDEALVSAAASLAATGAYVLEGRAQAPERCGGEPRCFVLGLLSAEQSAGQRAYRELVAYALRLRIGFQLGQPLSPALVAFATSHLAFTLWADSADPGRVPDPSERPVIDALIARLDLALSNARIVELTLLLALLVVGLPLFTKASRA
mgnify:CR=1 FL=1